jgi:hypothetical protein
MRQKYQVSEKQMREVFGDKWPAKLATLVKDVDYVERRCFKSVKRVYREDILASLETIVAASETIVAAHKLEPGLDQVDTGDLASQAVVTQRYPNPRYVNTTVGKVFVGGKAVKLGQKILVKEGKMVVPRASYLQ